MLRAVLLALALSAPVFAQGVPLDPEPDERPTEAPRPTPRPAPEPTVVRPGTAVAQARIDRGPRRVGGPRTGLTILSPGTVDRINEAYDTGDGDARISQDFPVVTQFGWQFENRLFQTDEGLTGLAEWVVLLGGADRGVFLPSLTFLAGLRAPGGFEVGVGPNLSLGGAAYAIAVGATTAVGEVGIPMNVAVVFGQDGPRASVLVGFTVSNRRW
ncbi:hypothetical protein [Rubrivirga sp. IMCC43871]|uniref:hypothetical protein n=1 Tax=Rubrivirga sp. IMCC43871 TaxID=3391575 RepID=UPI00398FDE26